MSKHHRRHPTLNLCIALQAKTLLMADMAGATEALAMRAQGLGANL
jgi:hypothetical protein